MAEDSDTVINELSSLLGDFSHLAARIRHIAIPPEISEKLSGRGSYVALRDGSPTISEFVQTFAHHLAAYALPRAKVIEASVRAGSDPSKQLVEMSRLREEAADLFIKAKKGSARSGEFGEIALYILIEWLLGAPQIVSKMYLKTAFQMPVHGTDGIHARLDDDGSLILIWGESKAHQQFSSALDDALQSIRKFVEKEEEDREVRLISGHLDLGEVSSEFRAKIMRYLNPYEEESNQRVGRFAVLLIYQFEYGEEGDANDEDIVARFTAKWEQFTASLPTRIENVGLKNRRFDFFLLPVPNVQEIRDRFQSIVGLPKDD